MLRNRSSKIKRTALLQQHSDLQTAQLSLVTWVPSLEPRLGGRTLQSGHLTTRCGWSIPPVIKL